MPREGAIVPKHKVSAHMKRAVRAAWRRKLGLIKFSATLPCSFLKSQGRQRNA